MNYMINNEASKQVAIEFAKWTILNGMWNSDLTFEEQYECWVSELDSQATSEVAGDMSDTWEDPDGNQYQIIDGRLFENE
jgi:predicted lipoprotein